jgi:DNA-directed RNA polymerase subunit L
MPADNAFLVRISTEQKKALAIRAHKEGRTIAGHIRWLIAQDCGVETPFERATRSPNKPKRKTS